MSLDVYLTATRRTTVFEANVTHNLAPMAREAGIWKELWAPEEAGILTAIQLIGPLQRGLALLRSDPERFRTLNPPNGWGDYEGFVVWVERYLEACRENPDAEIRISK
jgi:hypothetical protein